MRQIEDDLSRTNEQKELTKEIHRIEKKYSTDLDDFAWWSDSDGPDVKKDQMSLDDKYNRLMNLRKKMIQDKKSEILGATLRDLGQEDSAEGRKILESLLTDDTWYDEQYHLKEKR